MQNNRFTWHVVYKQIEHAMIIDNAPDFNDTIYNSSNNQKQNRLRIKGKKIANWTGRFNPSDGIS